tara:strand:- start:3733 stop:4029 length:297 start_codon:yes stop_codon:yes gene_type:complete
METEYFILYERKRRCGFNGTIVFIYKAPHQEKSAVFVVITSFFLQLIIIVHTYCVANVFTGGRRKNREIGAPNVEVLFLETLLDGNKVLHDIKQYDGF